MKRGFILFLFILVLIPLGGCTKKEDNGNPPIENGEDKVRIDYVYNLDNTLVSKAESQFNLVQEKLRMANGQLSENPAGISVANLWTYSSYFTTANQIYMMNQTDANKKLLDEAVEELEWYKATEREDNHLVYASLNGREVPAFFDDNVWLVIGWINGYLVTKDEDFLNKAKLVMDWIYTGWQPEGGLYWREFPEGTPSHQRVRNTCINGPSAWASALLYEITGELNYLDWSMKIYTWTKNNLYDRHRKVYNDNVDADGNVTPWRFTYNQGTMMSAAAILYKLTNDDNYKNDVADYMEGAENEFYLANLYNEFPNGEFYTDNPWFRVYLVQGFFDAMRYVDVNYGLRLERVKEGVLYGFKNHLDDYGFLKEDWSGRVENEGSGGTSVRTLFALGNIEIIAILAQYEDYIKEVTK